MAAWIDVGAADSVTESSPLATEVDGYPLFAVEDRCSHHGARFSLRTGEQP